MSDLPTSYRVARDLGYSFQAIECVTHRNEKIRATELVERLMDLDEYNMKRNWDRSWIEDFSIPNYTERRDTFADVDKSAPNKKSDLRQKLEQETFKLLCERNCIVCFQRERSLLILPCAHTVLCSSCYATLDTKRCPLCSEEIYSTAKVYLP